jgi:hypothetical protein
VSSGAAFGRELGVGAVFVLHDTVDPAILTSVAAIASGSRDDLAEWR